MTREIHGWHVGRTTRKGQPVDHEVIPVVTAVPSRELHAFLGSTDDVEIRRFLRRLRSEGQLVASQKHRLTQKVRGQGRQYVFRGDEASIPRIREGRRSRVIRWS